MTTPAVITLAFVLAACAPPSAFDSRPVLQRVADAGITVQGRDPLAGTGLCGALLPVHGPNDVHYVNFPRRFSMSDLRLLQHLPNVQQVRCNRTISVAEFDAILASVGTGTWILCKVQGSDGVIPYGYRRAIRDTDEDLNGDGIVDELDVMLSEQDGGG